ncbi:NhaP-type Na+/H+ or K+/H+ antiporter [Micromonospora nigra]|uniref:NhaP-type Na+/H+ or K+/H+ antiporter n=2 Tax=Micromonospora nigra TaxID=145857 RepID=A0A1C6RBE9_9ACTN|nr:NhaP-type Na+/H+ or K+/H+ antiporter [Micromonospora nigra]
MGYALIGSLAVLLVFWSSAIRNAIISEPLLALGLGVLAGPVLGVLDIADADVSMFTFEASRLLLAISLMAVALRFPLAAYRAVGRPVAVLLTAALLGMTLVSSGLAWLVLGLPLSLAVLLGACVAPTDPVLAASIVSGGPAERELPARLRQIISAESGGNDGLAFPLVVVVLAATGAGTWGERTVEALWGVGGAILVGVVVGALAGWAVRAALRREDVDEGSLLIFALVLAVAALGIGALLRTDDVLAVFVTGLAYNAVIKDFARVSEQKLDDSLSRYLLLPLFVLLGLELPWRAWLDLGWPLFAFVLGVLLLRRLPVVLALRPALAMSARDVVFLGWFGPIGVSALFYVTFSEHEGVRDPRLWAAGSLVVVASTVVHGITATPARRRYAGAAQARGGGGAGQRRDR